MDKKSTDAVSFFNIFIAGQIESATFPLGPDASEIFCRYESVAGPDWELVSGHSGGITQSASNSSGAHDKIIFNMPIEQTYRSTNPFGWPQLIVCIYGKSRWGAETVLGYARTHVPMFAASTERSTINAPILIPQCTNLVSEMAAWISGKNPELKNPKILLDPTKTKGLSVESYGELQLKLSIISRGIGRLGFDWG